MDELRTNLFKSFKCPYLDNEGCQATPFNTKEEAAEHALWVHRDASFHATASGSFLCLHRNQPANWACTTVFKDMGHLKAHLLTTHESGLDLFKGKWQATKEYDESVTNLKQQNLPGGRQIVIDTECSMVSLQLLEVSIIDRVSGECILNTLIKYPQALDHSLPESQKVSSSDRSMPQMNVHDIAAALQRAGVTPQSIVFTWHVNCFDLEILRKFLEADNYQGILPANKNCFPMIPQFRRNFPLRGPDQRRFPMAMEFIFPLFYPDSDMIGRNDQTLFDCQRTRLLCDVFDHHLRKGVDDLE
ncbi:zinc finger protein [Fusarium napiforme]|uniref:Zinc finger protein n=1 Tax=Fusarium napiforme TaxID=42672 RepID=A0A8H5MP80_9HYPO|nr:zinc finger protein [Fusarium napiforme]